MPFGARALTAVGDNGRRTSGVQRMCATARDDIGDRTARGSTTPEDAAARIREAVGELPVAHLIFWSSIAAMPEDLVLANIELICDRLLPLLRAETKPPAGADQRRFHDLRGG